MLHSLRDWNISVEWYNLLRKAWQEIKGGRTSFYMGMIILVQKEKKSRLVE